MAKQLVCFFLFSISNIYFAIADQTAASVLQHRLKKIENFYVYVIQKIVSSDGISLEESQGELWVKQPNFIYWHMVSPEENFLISDGKTLWFYIPAIQQVIACWVDNFINDTFLMFFSNKNVFKCDNYHIQRQGDVFFIVPLIVNNGTIKKFEIKILGDGKIEQFNIINKYNQYISYYFSKHNFNNINISKFFFNCPKNIQLDDQRK